MTLNVDLPPNVAVGAWLGSGPESTVRSFPGPAVPGRLAGGSAGVCWTVGSCCESDGGSGWK